MKKYILIYIIFKLNFFSGKTVILCENLNQVYKLYLFLERIGEK
jgi:hypothetical protein